MEETQYDNTEVLQDIKIYGTERRHPFLPGPSDAIGQAECQQIIRGKDGLFRRCGRTPDAAVHIGGGDSDLSEDPDAKKLFADVLGRMERLAARNDSEPGRSAVDGWKVWLPQIEELVGRLDVVAMFPGWKSARIDCLAELSSLAMMWAMELEKAQRQAHENEL